MAAFATVSWGATAPLAQPMPADCDSIKLTGRSACAYASGDRYEGDFKAGRFDGRGTYTWHNGDRYEGGFKDGNFDGHGVLTRPGGSRFDGEFKDDRPNGPGTLKLGNGNVYTGTWAYGCFRDGDRMAWFRATEQECGF